VTIVSRALGRMLRVEATLTITRRNGSSTTARIDNGVGDHDAAPPDAHTPTTSVTL
jgi:hypothetical protein